MKKETNIKTMRKILGFTQKELAQKLNVTPTSVNVLERKGCYDTRTAVKYAKAMGCNPLFLLDGLSIIQS